MGAGSFIGRVGGLAIALGVGTAIFTGHGVALADDTGTESGSSSSTDSSPSGPASRGSSPSSTGPSGDPKTSDEKRTNSAGEPDPDGDTSNGSKTVASDVVEGAQTNIPGAPDSPSEMAEPETEPELEPETANPPPTSTEPEPTEVEEPTVPEPEALSARWSRSSGTNDDPPTVTVDPISDPAAVPAISAAVPTVSALDLTTIAPLPALAARSGESLPVAAAVTPVDTPPTGTVPPRNPVAAVTSVMSSVANWLLSPFVGATPTKPGQSPLAWTLLAYVRREFENFVAAVGARGAITEEATLAAQSTSLALTDAPFAAAVNVASAASAVNVPGYPLPGAQLSPSTQFVNWVTGNYQIGNPLMADTANRFGIWGTDVGVIWDNGMVDDPSTPSNERQVLIALGDTFSGPNMTGVWRYNTLLRSSDTNLANGIEIPGGEWFNGNMFGGAPLSDPTFARPIINRAAGLPGGVTLIPTAGISIPTPGTRFGVTQYVNFMSVSQWGAAGSWTTNYSGIAYSTDNGENFTIAPSSIRYNQPWSGNQNFQQGAFVRPGDGYVYNYGTPNGRQGAAYVSRVLERDILDVTKYEYYSKGQQSWFSSTPAGWYRNNPAAATPVFGAEGGACRATAAGNTVSEMSVQYNKQLKKYVTIYGDQNNSIVMRTSDTPQGEWSPAKVLMNQQPGGIYAPMMHPWSSSTMGTGTDLYWNLSLYSEYNVMLMRTDLTKV